MNPNPPEETPTDTAERLACGRDLEQLWRDWENGTLDDHSRECPHCSSALDGLRQLGEVVRQARWEENHRSDQQPRDTGQLTQRVMEAVRLELRPGRTLPLGAPDEDSWMVEAAAAKVFRAAADALPGVSAGSCRIREAEGAGGRRSRGPVRVRMEVAVTLERSVRDTAGLVRQCVLDVAERELGMAVRAVDVAVTEVLDPRPTEGEDGHGR
ncbi:hypothetical protein [Streptomyces sp. NPDC005438]|uniref:hypothetical protein n=1 Tax=Streptomyces sp. NPDC005438 TaxID=3156880 RepID=UPI0033B23719